MKTGCRGFRFFANLFAKKALRETQVALIVEVKK